MNKDATNARAGETANHHPIQVVTRSTGLSSDRIRAWEKRYRVVRPARSGANRRLYSDADVQRLSLLPKQVRLIVNAPGARPCSSVLNETETLHVHGAGELCLALDRLAAGQA